MQSLREFLYNFFWFLVDLGGKVLMRYKEFIDPRKVVIMKFMEMIWKISSKQTSECT